MDVPFMKLQVCMDHLVILLEVHLFTSFMATLMTVFSQIIMTLKATTCRK